MYNIAEISSPVHTAHACINKRSICISWRAADRRIEAKRAKDIIQVSAATAGCSVFIVILCERRHVKSFLRARDVHQASSCTSACTHFPFACTSQRTDGEARIILSRFLRPPTHLPQQQWECKAAKVGATRTAKKNENEHKALAHGGV